MARKKKEVVTTKEARRRGVFKTLRGGGRREIANAAKSRTSRPAAVPDYGNEIIFLTLRGKGQTSFTNEVGYPTLEADDTGGRN